MADNLDILDGGAAPKVVRTRDGAGVHTPYHTLDTQAADLIGAANRVGSASFASPRVAITTSSSIIVAARTGRVSVTVSNPVDALGPIAIGPSTTVLATSHNLLPGDSVTIPTQAAVHGIAASAGSVDIVETF